MWRVVTMVSSTPCCKSPSLQRRCWRWLLATSLAWALALLCAAPVRAGTEVTQMRVERSGDDLLLSAQVQFELASAVEDVLVKGVPVVFTFSADLLRERWYWFDRKVSGVERSARVVYQPLTRRWRVAVGAAGAAAGNGGLALTQTYDTLPEALSAIRRVVGWRVADATELEPGVKYRVDFRFRLDMAQLPRPLQIGVLGQSDWDVAASASQVWQAEGGK